MFSKLTAEGRIWILLIAWILFTGFCVADMFDLSDDVVWPTGFGQPAIALESTEDSQKAHVVVLPTSFSIGATAEPLSLRFGSEPSTLFFMPLTCSDTPLYQRHSVYRI